MSWGIVLLACIPIFFLLVAILGFRINTVIAGALAAITAALLSLLIFGADFFLLRVATYKGLSLSLFILLIVWTSLLLYNMMKSLGLMQVIAGSIARITDNRLGQALLCSWAFAGFIEGIAGFGVPVAIIAPLMITLGFDPLTSVIAVLVGHSWAVTFGAMGAAYYTIQLSTGLPGEALGPTMALLFALPIITTGLSVAHIEGGRQSLKQALLPVPIIGLAVFGCLWLSTRLNIPQVAAISAGLVGCIFVWVLSKTPLLKKPHNEAPAVSTSENAVSFHLAFIPYYLLIILAISFQLPAVKQATGHLFLAFDYPGVQTSLGYVVAPSRDYAKIYLFGHPALIIAVSFLSTIIIFRWSNRWRKNILADAFKTTFRQCLQPSLSIISMVVMSLIMNDSGMTNAIALGLADTTGIVYPVISPYIGVLGCFMTGSNTNSNVMLGSLQAGTAVALGISPLIIAGAQSVGGSIGAAIAPAKVLLGSSVSGIGGRESEIMRKTLVYCLIIALLVGLESWLAVYLI